jgi:hypothetical protein
MDTDTDQAEDLLLLWLNADTDTAAYSLILVTYDVRGTDVLYSYSFIR